MCRQAFDQFGRTVFFKEILGQSESKAFIAFDESGEECFYSTRHRLDGPAIVDGNNRRRWFFFGEERTKEIEEAILLSGEECFENYEDFQLNENGKDVLCMLEL